MSETRYGLCHPEKEKFSEELLRYGEIKANSEIQEIDGTNIRIRCIRYKDKIWFHHMEDGENHWTIFGGFCFKMWYNSYIIFLGELICTIIYKSFALHTYS